MTTPLVTASQYVQWTGDIPAVGADVTAALAEAQAAVDEYCRRTFAYGTYSETLYIYPDGKVYPSATPLDLIVDPAGQWSVQGAGVWIGWWDPFPLLAGTTASQMGGYPPQTTITYKGGYQPAGTLDGQTPPVPMKVARAIAQLAWKSLHPVQLPSLPGNVNSVHVGDVGYSGSKPLTVGELIDDSMEKILNGFQRRDVRAWQSKATPA